MNEAPGPVELALLAFPEATASVVYGMYDLFMSAGRDWPMIVDGAPGLSLMLPRVVAREAGLVRAANGVPILAHASFANGELPRFVCVPEVAVAPDEPLERRFAAEIEWLRRCYEAGATVATACSGALLLAEAGLLDGEEATTHWAYCDTLARRYPRVLVRPQRALVVAGEGQRLVMAGGRIRARAATDEGQGAAASAGVWW